MPTWLELHEQLEAAAANARALSRGANVPAAVVAHALDELAVAVRAILKRGPLDEPDPWHDTIRAIAYAKELVRRIGFHARDKGILVIGDALDRVESTVREHVADARDAE